MVQRPGGFWAGPHQMTSEAQSKAYHESQWVASPNRNPGGGYWGWVGAGLAALSHAKDSSPVHGGALDGNQEVHGGVQKQHPPRNLCLGGTPDEMPDDLEDLVTLEW